MDNALRDDHVTHDPLAHLGVRWTEQSRPVRPRCLTPIRHFAHINSGGLQDNSATKGHRSESGHQKTPGVSAALAVS
jgi:hypothetical protein